MATFCGTVQFYLRHLEGSAYPVMTEEQFAVKLFPMYRYFISVWLKHQQPEVRHTLFGNHVPFASFSQTPQSMRSGDKESPLDPALFLGPQKAHKIWMPNGIDQQGLLHELDLDKGPREA
jgi:hypothetical protein